MDGMEECFSTRSSETPRGSTFVLTWSWEGAKMWTRSKVELWECGYWESPDRVGYVEEHVTELSNPIVVYVHLYSIYSLLYLHESIWQL